MTLPAKAVVAAILLSKNKEAVEASLESIYS